MISGTITTKDILSHPVLMIQEYGFASYLGLIWKGLSYHDYQFLSLILSLEENRNRSQSKI